MNFYNYKGLILLKWTTKALKNFIIILFMDNNLLGSWIMQMQRRDIFMISLSKAISKKKPHNSLKTSMKQHWSMMIRVLCSLRQLIKTIIQTPSKNHCPKLELSLHKLILHLFCKNKNFIKWWKKTPNY